MGYIVTYRIPKPREWGDGASACNTREHVPIIFAIVRFVIWTVFNRHNRWFLWHCEEIFVVCATICKYFLKRSY